MYRSKIRYVKMDCKNLYVMAVMCRRNSCHVLSKLLATYISCAYYMV